MEIDTIIRISVVVLTSLALVFLLTALVTPGWAVVTKDTVVSGVNGSVSRHTVTLKVGINPYYTKASECVYSESGELCVNKDLFDVPALSKYN